MTILSEDPTILAGGLAALASVFLVALRATQQGKYLAYAGVAFGLALVVLATERLWVTDAERIESVVYQLRDAVAKSDADAVLEHLAPNVQYGRSRGVFSSEQTREIIKSTLRNTHFDFVRVGQLRTNVGQQSRRGTAEFRVFAKGRFESSVGAVNTGAVNIGAVNTEWSLSFKEVEPHVWKVNRITPVNIPEGTLKNEREVLPNDSQERARGRFRRR